MHYHYQMQDWPYWIPRQWAVKLLQEGTDSKQQEIRQSVQGLQRKERPSDFAITISPDQCKEGNTALIFCFVLYQDKMKMPFGIEKPINEII